MKFSLILPFVALVSQVFAAQQSLPNMPPGCLLHAVNTQDSPSDMSAVCGTSASKVQQAIADLCSESNADVAQSMFIETCKGKGIQVAAYTPSSDDVTSTRNGSPSQTTLAVVTTDANGHTVTKTQTADNPHNTGAAAIHKGMGMYIMAMVAVGCGFAAL